MQKTRAGSCGRGAHRAATSYLIRYSLEPFWCQLARRFLSHPLGDAVLGPRATARTHPDWLRTCPIVWCACPAVSLRSGAPLSLTAPLQVARSSSASLRALSCTRCSDLYFHGRTMATTCLLSLLHRAIYSRPVPLTCASQRIYRPGTHFDRRRLCDIFSVSFSSSPMFSRHRTTIPHHVTPLLLHRAARRHTRPRHVATLSSLGGCSWNMQQVCFAS